MTPVRDGAHTTVDIADDLLRRYDVCDHCLGRLFAMQTRPASYMPLGRRLRGAATAQRMRAANTPCYICKNLFDGMAGMLQLMGSVSEEYEFDSFAVGAVIKPSIMDRDDHIRSAYRLRGADGVKTGVTRELGRRFAKMTGSTQDRYEPEILLTVRPAEGYCDIRSKPVAIYGRYTKHQRGISQKHDACTSCLGRGCFACSFHGMSPEHDSVEGRISDFLFERMGGTTARFTWIGGEDAQSLVSGRGRPFFVRIQSPKKGTSRCARTQGSVSYRLTDYMTYVYPM